MIWYLGLATLVGISIVFQNGINQQIALRSDLSSTLFFNSAVCLVAAGVLFLFSVLKPTWLPEILRSQTALPSWNTWVVLSGVMGFIIIFGLPLAINRLGTVKVITWVITVQILAALVWDAAIMDSPVTAKRVLGAIITLAGALLTVAG